MNTRISQQQLESYLWGAATLLRGTIDAGDYKQFIFPLLFFKRLCDVFDEETQAALKESGGDKRYAAGREQHRFQVPADAHWRQVRKEAKNVGAALQTAMRAIETANTDKLFGIFGDAQWTNKDRLSDAMLRDLIEHFSSLELTVANLPEDELGNGYEYLIKKFADDSGHTAAEFYTNRTVVHLMTEILQPQPGDAIYDPTCGSGGMLLSCVAHLRRNEQEWRNVRLFGQERNLMTSSIARMNCFLHGLEDFQIVRGDTLSDPKLVRGDRLMQFDVALANPPYSIKQWDRDAFASDPWGRNLYGTPPQGRADYAFWQHILCSLKPKTGRCAILFPHGVLFRQEEAEMRRKLVDADLIDCVIGLGPNLFYNSPMEACVVICRTGKPKARKGRILFINAVDEVTRERSQSFLTDEHIARIVGAYKTFKDEGGFARVATIEDIRAKDANLSMPLYVAPAANGSGSHDDKRGVLPAALSAWLKRVREVRASLTEVLAPPAAGVRGAKNGTTSALDRLQPHHDWATLPLFSRKGWSRRGFGDMVENLNERVEPADAADAIYVGLEHLETACLHIRRSGKGSDVIGTKLRFRKGDIIFGRRRAYQRKVAIAEVDGICSAHAMVVRAKPDKVLPELLPFLMMSDKFMNRAVEISIGSLSPTINWTTLKLEEFDLPPIEQQQRIAALLWTIDQAMESMRSLSDIVADYRNAQIMTVMRENVLPLEQAPDGQPLRELFDERRETGFGNQRILAVTIAGKVVPRESLERSVIDKTGTEKYFRVRAGDIAYNTMRMWQGSCGVVREEGIISPAYTVLVPRADRADPDFWNYAFHTPEMLDWFRRFSTGVASDRWRLYYRDFARIPARIPPLEVQHQSVRRFALSEHALTDTQRHVERLWDVLQTAVNTVFRYPQ